MKILALVNFVGLLLAAGLCAVQWRQNRHDNRWAVALDRARQIHERKIEELEAGVRQYQADLEEFRDRLTTTEADLRKTETALDERTAERDQVALQRDTLTAQRDQLLESRRQLEAEVETYTRGVKERDAILAEANGNIQTLAAERDDMVKKYNDLALKYNALVKAANSARAGR